MSDELFQRLLSVIAAELAKQHGSVPPADLIRHVREADSAFSTADVRQAIWHLESERQLDFDEEWRIRRTTSAFAPQ